MLARRPEPLLPPNMQAIFTRVVKRGFSQRRKMMHKLLKAEWPEDTLRGAFARIGLSAQVRAEKVSLEQFVELTKDVST